MMDLKQKAVLGAKWSTLSQIGRQGTQLFTTVILAHFLSPSDFGLLGMAMVVIGFIGIFKDLGTSAAIIQQKELSNELLNSVFWVNLGFGVLAMVILVVFAPLVSVIYQEPRIVNVLRILAINFSISGLGILHQTLLERSLAFSSLAKLEIISVIVGALIGIGLAIINFGVWSLVYQSLITALVSTVLLWWSNSWRPNRVFHWKQIKTVSSFSLNLTGFNIFNYFARNADYLLIGRYLGAQDLGYYILAYRILLFPIQNITTVIGRVMYPVLSTVQDNNERFNSIYLKVVGYVALVTFPLMLGVLALAELLILIFFGEKWQPVIQLVRIFAPIGLIQSIGATVGTIYQVKGRTDWMFRWGVGSGTVVVIAFWIGLKWGVVGVATAYAIVSLIAIYFVFAIPFRLVGLRFIQLLKAIRLSLLNSSLMFIALMAFKIILHPLMSNIVGLTLSVIVGVAIYSVTNWLTNQKQLKELWELSGLQRRKLHETG